MIVSGLAIGIDSIAHESALESGLPTVAVLCSGLEWNSIYPQSNVNLAKEIVASGGGLLSEFSSTYFPRKFNFPERNRIMAGISQAVLVIEASQKSGTLITARLATEYNRDVFAVPGSIFNEMSKGPNSLIAQGAKLISGSSDIIEELGLKNNQSASTDVDISEMTETEKLIYTNLKAPVTRAELLQNIGVNGETVKALSVLEMKKIVVELNGKLNWKNC